VKTDQFFLTKLVKLKRFSTCKRL